MKPPNIWTELGIAKTRNRGEIRRAYARTIDVERDGDSFRALRSAYEQALDVAEGSVGKFSAKPSAGLSHGDARSPGERAGSRTPEAAIPRMASATDGIVERRPMDASGDADELRAARGRLEALLANHPPLNKSELEAALQEVLANRLLESIAYRIDTERWLAGLIVSRAPYSDPLIGPAVEAFRWGERTGETSSDSAINAVINRSDDLRLICDMRSRKQPQERAWQTLIEPFQGPPLDDLVWWPSLTGEVRELLSLIRVTRPRLLAEFDPQALSWWERYLSRPRFPPLGMVAVTVVAFAGVPVLMGLAPSLRDKFPEVVVLSLLAGLIAALAIFYGLVWPRHIWRTRFAKTASSWARFGWAPLLALVLIAASLMPNVWPIRAAIAVLSAVGAGWAIAVGGGDRTPFRAKWLVAIYDGCALLAIWWALALTVIPTAIFWSMTMPLAAAFIGTTWNGGALARLWQTAFSARNRHWPLISLVILASISPGFILLCHNSPGLWPFAAATVGVTVLVQRAPAMLVVSGMIVRFLVLWITVISIGFRTDDPKWSAPLALEPIALVILATGALIPVAAWLEPMLLRRRGTRLGLKRRSPADG